MITDGFAGWSKIKLDFYAYCFYSGVVLLLYQNRKDNRNFSLQSEGISKDKQQICDQAYFIGRLKNNKPRLL